MKVVGEHSLQTVMGESGPFHSPTVSVVFHFQLLQVLWWEEITFSRRCQQREHVLVSGGILILRRHRDNYSHFKPDHVINEGGGAECVCGGGLQNPPARSEESGDSVSGSEDNRLTQGRRKTRSPAVNRTQKHWKKEKRYNTSTWNGQQLHLQDNSWTYTDKSHTITYIYW